MNIADKLRDWMESDLVGIPVTLAAVAVIALAIGGFILAGPIAGILFAILGLGLVYLLITRPGSKAPADPEREIGRTPRAAARAGNGATRVLVVANSGLERPELAARLQRIAAEGRTEIHIVAPAPAPSRLEALADDVDAERRSAEVRLQTLLSGLRAERIEADGRVDEEGDPRSALADGLREFAADEVVVVPGEERGWEEAAMLVRELRADGVAVTDLGPR